MRAVVLLVSFWMSCLAQRPEPCSSPPLLSGGLSISTQAQELAAFAKYSYDGLGKRIRLTEFGSYGNTTFQLDVLLLFKQGFMYKINNKDRTCFKKHLMEDFHPLAIPNDASLVGQAVLGSSSVQGEGILVNTWTGVLPLRKRLAKYLSTVTEFGCFPVNTLVSTDNKGWVLVRSVNICDYLISFPCSLELFFYFIECLNLHLEAGLRLGLEAGLQGPDVLCKLDSPIESKV
ncbi:Ependymin-2 [Oryzias melastigma]|uniref:Ependymin-2 n=1 Tax=Oryzias melastigma TaxID=30732 RepID=A0A3B3BIZ0_ORYME|nr:Ependymin-2 [Oryzias melastigma]